MKQQLLIMVIFLGSLGSVSAALAAMSSASYQISADYIGVGGGWSSSTNYTLNDSVANLGSGFVSSTSYQVQGGFVSNDSGTIGLSISATSVSLGTLSVSAVSSGSVVATVTTDQSTGFTLAVGSVSGSSPTAVSDGAVTAGSEEYGITTSGTYSAVSTHVAVVAGLTLASASVPVTNEATTLTFKASRNTNSTAATYSQTVVLSAATNF